MCVGNLKVMGGGVRQDCSLRQSTAFFLHGFREELEVYKLGRVRDGVRLCGHHLCWCRPPPSSVAALSCSCTWLSPLTHSSVRKPNMLWLSLALQSKPRMYLVLVLDLRRGVAIV